MSSRSICIRGPFDLRVKTNMAALAGFELPRLDWSAAELPVEFANFRQYCDLIFGGPLADIAEPKKFTYVLLWVGKEGLRIYNTRELTEAQRTVETLWERYTDILQPKSNHRLNRFNLQRYRQEISESVDEFMTR